MQIRFISPGEYHEWDSFVDNSPQGDVFCYSWWLSTVTDNNFRILAVWKNNLICAAMILPFFDSGVINEPPLTRTLGVLFRRTENIEPYHAKSEERKYLIALVEHLPKERFVQMCMSDNFTDWLPFLWKGYKQKNRCTYLIDYREQSLESIRKNISINQKRNIIKAINSGAKIIASGTVEQLYELSCITYKRQGIRFHYSFSLLKKLDTQLAEKNMRVIFSSVFPDGKVHGIYYTMWTGKKVYGWQMASDDIQRDNGGNALLLYSVIEYFYKKADTFNFGGSDIERIEKYLRQFGGKMVPYFHIFNDEMLDYSQQESLEKTLMYSKILFRKSWNRLIGIKLRRIPGFIIKMLKNKMRIFA
ncbi:MAG: GNAT family N-acetyltransferase [Candidatus Riflebacteria bacterium]|nr:GNAT family N-acetyltransferase [Candidatus Riflebacteria bacterium]